MKVLPVPEAPTNTRGSSCWMARFKKYSCFKVSDVGTIRFSPLPDGAELRTLKLHLVQFVRKLHFVSQFNCSELQRPHNGCQKLWFLSRYL